MAYSVKEVFLTLQGEGAQAGRAAVFLRFSGCNLWSGREQDREKSICKFCDTDFLGTDGPGGGRFATAESLAAHVASFWPAGGRRYVVCTGGEPALQLDGALVDALHHENFEIAIETNGTVALPEGIDWVCVSPKAGSRLVVGAGDELKLVYPQVESAAHPSVHAQLDFAHFMLQPLDGPSAADNTAACIDYCLAHPQWRLSVQMHKFVGIA